MDRNCIITGANRGIGKEVVRAFAENGDNIWACIRKPNSDFENYCGILMDQYGIWIKCVIVDLSIEKDIIECMDKINKEKKSVDILVNCAGIGHMGLLQMTSSENIRKIFEVNVFAIIETCRWAVRIMSKQKHGIIINISSTAAEETYVGNSIYGSSKACINAFSKSLAAEVAPFGIRVNAIAPGLTDTEMSSIFEGNNASLPLERTVLGRKLDPKEIAEVVIALTSDPMKMINGQVICVNGGSK